MNQWQKNLCNEIMLGGVSKGELTVIATSRNIGKSQLMKLWNQVYFNEVKTLDLDEGKVYGETYYVVKPYGYNWFDLEEWCVESFGPSPKEGVWQPGARWYANSASLWFRDPKDRDWFLMRWS